MITKWSTAVGLIGLKKGWSVVPRKPDPKLEPPSPHRLEAPKDPNPMTRKIEPKSSHT